MPERGRLVEDFVADRPGGHQALAGHQQAGGGDLVAVDLDGRAVTAELILDAGLVEGGDDFGGFLGVEVGPQDLLGLGHEAAGQGDDRRQQADPDAGHDQQPDEPRTPQRAKKPVHLGSRPRNDTNARFCRVR